MLFDEGAYLTFLSQSSFMALNLFQFDCKKYAQFHSWAQPVLSKDEHAIIGSI